MNTKKMVQKPDLQAEDLSDTMIKTAQADTHMEVPKALGESEIRKLWEENRKLRSDNSDLMRIKFQLEDDIQELKHENNQFRELTPDPVKTKERLELLTQKYFNLKGNITAMLQPLVEMFRLPIEDADLLDVEQIMSNSDDKDFQRVIITTAFNIVSMNSYPSHVMHFREVLKDTFAKTNEALRLNAQMEESVRKDAMKLAEYILTMTGRQIDPHDKIQVDNAYQDALKMIQAERKDLYNQRYNMIFAHCKANFLQYANFKAKKYADAQESEVFPALHVFEPGMNAQIEAYEKGMI